jgi:hypothetical protein
VSARRSKRQLARPLVDGAALQFPAVDNLHDEQADAYRYKQKGYRDDSRK